MLKEPTFTEPISFTKTNQYGCGSDDEDDVYTITEWLNHVKEGSFIDYDGFGYLVKDKKADPRQIIKPSMVKKGEFNPHDATHIIWFNR